MRWILLISLLLPTVGGCASNNPEPAEPVAAEAKTADPGGAGEAKLDESAESSDPKPLPDRDPQLAKKLVSEGAVLLDVRTQEEWDERHLDGANHIPVQDLGDRLGEVEKLTGGKKDKPIVVYCKSGGRAGRAKEKLTEAGYTQVTNMGGIDDWPDE